MKIEIHILQNFAPSNLNRDDTGAPKDCELGGYRRARISSQCLKRAVRDAFETDRMFAPDELAVRTKRLVDNVADLLAGAHQRDRTVAVEVVVATLAGAGLTAKAKDDYKTEYLLFLPKRNLAELAVLIDRHWDALAPLAQVASPQKDDGSATEPAAKPKSSKKEKAEKKGAFPREIAGELSALFADAGRTADLALFGRMIADKPEWNVEAACQVAHALSTNRVAMDFDFYTAVDDLRPADTAGSDMMGTVQFNSSCFYRYSVLDADDLNRNLGGDGELVHKTVAAFMRASVVAIPTGKQNSMAAHNPPSFVLAIVREKGSSVSLANAFAKPIRPNGETDLISASINALEAYLQTLSRMYGAEEAAAFYVADRSIPALSGPVALQAKDSLVALVDAVVSALPRAAV